MPGFLFDRILHIIPAAYKNDSIGLSYPTVARFLYAMLPGVAVEAVMDVRTPGVHKNKSAQKVLIFEKTQYTIFGLFETAKWYTLFWPSKP